MGEPVPEGRPGELKGGGDRPPGQGGANGHGRARRPAAGLRGPLPPEQPAPFLRTGWLTSLESEACDPRPSQGAHVRGSSLRPPCREAPLRPESLASPGGETATGILRLRPRAKCWARGGVLPHPGL